MRREQREHGRLLARADRAILGTQRRRERQHRAHEQRTEEPSIDRAR
jgi:hypothetical protein